MNDLAKQILELRLTKENLKKELEEYKKKNEENLKKEDKIRFDRGEYNQEMLENQILY